MKTLNTILSSLLLISLAGCGDDNKVDPDASRGDGKFNDAPNPDVTHVAGTPPTIGTQIDRMGRPAINTTLNGTLGTVTVDVTTQKDNYNRASDPATWATTVLFGTKTVADEFRANLAVFDVLDQGVTTIPGAGCSNQLLFNGVAAGGGTPVATSYSTFAGILADDRLYLDTSKGVCNRYLSIEGEVATNGTVKHTDCGGRALTYDVIDFTYSMLTGGVNAFGTDANRTALVSDGGVATRVVSHIDVSDTTFPFLGAPTNP